jgi:hypothetical protein
LAESLLTNEEVATFLSAHQAEAAFENVCKLAQTFFSERDTLEVMLQEDPDTIGRSQVVVVVRLAASSSDEQVRAALARYHERLVKEVPLDLCPLFALIPEFVVE